MKDRLRKRSPGMAHTRIEDDRVLAAILADGRRTVSVLSSRSRKLPTKGLRGDNVSGYPLTMERHV